MVGASQALSESLARFYTAHDISELLIGLMTAEAPESIIDLGAGTGSLSVAARRRWRNAEIVTVDIDTTAKPLASGAALDCRHRHLCADALDGSLPLTLIGLSHGFDAAVCNPPYVWPRWRDSFAEILEDAGLLAALPAVTQASADILFIAQNLRMLKDGGQIGLIVPDGLITGYRMANLRDLLLRTHRIEQVVQLPRCAFRNTDAQTYILVLSKAIRSDAAIALQKLSSDGVLSAPLFVDKNSAALRLDYDFHALHRRTLAHGSRSSPLTLAAIGARISRGTLNSRQARTAPFPVFHVQHFPSSKRGAFDVPDDLRIDARSARTSGVTVAAPGDILLARVGRGLEDKVCVIKSGVAAISDWIYRIEVDAPWRAPVANALLSESGKRELAAYARGVGAGHLPKAALLEMPLRLDARGIGSDGPQLP